MLTRTDIEVLQSLVVDDVVEVFDERGTVLWQGAVETSAPHLGFAWIRTDTGERKLLDIQAHSIRRCEDLSGRVKPSR